MGTTTVDVHITLARLVGTKSWTMEKGRRVMLGITVDPDNVSVLVVRSYFAIFLLPFLLKSYFFSMLHFLEIQ